MSEITHRTIKTNGIHLHIAEAGRGPMVLLLHGWPESWYSWRHQLPALAAAGYHAVAPDVRGYGQSDAPAPIEAYSLKTLLADFVGVLDALGEKTAAVVGHDWGAAMAYASAEMHPDRYRAVVGMGVPHMGRAPLRPTELFKSVVGDNWFYILYFQEPGLAEAELERDIPVSMRAILCSTAEVVAIKPKGSTLLSGAKTTGPTPPWLTESDLAFFAAEMTRSGFRGGLNRYRNMDRDWDELPHLGTAVMSQPALYVIGEEDPGRSFANADRMRALFPNLRRELALPGTGHWVQQERPSEVNAALLEFLGQLS